MPHVFSVGVLKGTFFQPVLEGVNILYHMIIYQEPEPGGTGLFSGSRFSDLTGIESRVRYPDWSL